MKSFNTAYQASRTQELAKRSNLVEQQHAEIVAAMKKEFGITDFSALNESERTSYRSMLKSMWNKETGITKKGVKFLTEAAAPLTKDSTEEQIKKVFMREIKPKLKDFTIAIISRNEIISELNKVKTDIEAEIGKKLSVKLCKTWLCEALTKYVADGIRSYKF